MQAFVFEKAFPVKNASAGNLGDAKN